MRYEADADSLKSVELSLLCDFYGGLLTQKQLMALRLSCEEDLSLGEIAQRLNVSRQNVHELITRSEQKLRRYEAVVGGVRRQRATVRRLSEAAALLSEDSEARKLIDGVIRLQEGEEDDGL